MSQAKRRLPTIFLILGLAFILRLPFLNGSFWLDEAAQALESSRPLNSQLEITDDFQPPLLHLLTHFSLRFSTSEWWLRLIGALIPGLLTIAGTYLLGKKIAGQKVGLAASLLLTTSSFHIFFSQELRPYSLSALFAVWSWLFLLETAKVGQDIYQFKTTSRVSKLFAFFPIPRDLFLFLLATILGLYSSYLYPFVYLAQLLYLLITRHWRNFTYALTIPTIAFLPWLPSFWQQLQAGQLLRTSFPGWENIVSFSLLKAPALTFGKFLFGVINLEFFNPAWQNSWPFIIVPNFSLALPYVLVCVIFVGLTLACLTCHTKQFYAQHRLKFLALGAGLLLPFIIASIVSLAVPVIQPKRVIFLLPFVYLLLAFLILGTRDDWRYLKLRHWFLLIFLLVLNLYGTTQYYLDPTLQRENWRLAVTTAHQEYSPTNTLALFSFTAPFAPWDWYERQWPQPFPTLSTGTYDFTQTASPAALLSPLTGYTNVITFDYLTSLTDPGNSIREHLNQFGYGEWKNYDYNTMGFVRIYKLQSRERLE